MFVKNISDCREFTANDGCRIREVLHPENDPVHLPYSLAHACIAPDSQSYRHRLKQAEVYYILAGSGVMHINEEQQPVKTGDMIYIPSDAIQWLENTGDTDLNFLALVSPPWNEKDDQRVDF